jgi:hypothetical protein
VQVFIQWGFEYLTFSRGARIITGTTVDDDLIQIQTSKSEPSRPNT